MLYERLYTDWSSFLHREGIPYLTLNATYQEADDIHIHRVGTKNSVGNHLCLMVVVRYSTDDSFYNVQQFATAPRALLGTGPLSLEHQLLIVSKVKQEVEISNGAVMRQFPFHSIC
ncbi:hypothetical protein PROFUN_09696 [Planoprotostelium fungivorum]|uniref:Uncharacterized protein n=1 Tax=Planoprotostelium fungivorum TaxID=1890364 RepID=A0A2P6NER6_9EUKA|nr:hypothetical protein PROFUN_09696 [Planoprotostelium fungivorum]